MGRNTIQDQIPRTEGITRVMPQPDFSDTFSTTNHTDDQEKLVRKIFGFPDGWIRLLMNLRTRIVRVFGLKTEKPADYNEEYRVGGYVGFFKIFSIEPNEVILGADDEHLDFRVSIYDSRENQYNIKVTTLVKFNNRFGKIYMALIAPFHRMVVKSMVNKAFISSQS